MHVTGRRRSSALAQLSAAGGDRSGHHGFLGDVYVTVEARQSFSRFTRWRHRRTSGWGLGAGLDLVGARRPDPFRARGNPRPSPGCGGGAVRGFQRQDYVDLMQLTGVGGCRRVDAVAERSSHGPGGRCRPNARRAVSRSRDISHASVSLLALGRVDAGDEAVVGWFGELVRSMNWMCIRPSALRVRRLRTAMARKLRTCRRHVTADAR